MSILLLFFLTLLLFFTGLFHYKKTGMIIFILVLFLFIWFGDGYFAVWTLPKLETNEIISEVPTWGTKNIIMVLGAGTVLMPNAKIVPSLLGHSRILQAGKLYYACMQAERKCTLLLRGGDAAHTGESEAAVYQHELLQLGVNLKDIILEQNSLNTYQNAEFIQRILKTQTYDHLYLVTSGLHMKRSLDYFAYFHIYPKPILSDYIAPFKSLLPGGYHFAIADFIIHEYIGMARLRIYDYLGWNTKPVINN